MGNDVEETMTLKEAAAQVLETSGPLHYRELSDAIQAAGLAHSTSADPAASLNARIAMDIKRKGKQSAFFRLKPGVFGLRGLHESPVSGDLGKEPEDLDFDGGSDQRVRVPLFPTYAELRHLLSVWPGWRRKGKLFRGANGLLLSWVLSWVANLCHVHYLHQIAD